MKYLRETITPAELAVALEQPSIRLLIWPSVVESCMDSKDGLTEMSVNILL